MQWIGFDTPEDGFGLWLQAGKTCATLIAATSDGGATFGPLVPVEGSGVGCGVDAVAFDHQGDAFAYGPGLLVTRDGGRNWIPLPQPGAVLSIQSVGTALWMVESGCPDWETNPAPPCQELLFSSSDGARSWTAVPTPPGETVDAGTGTGFPGQTYLIGTASGNALLLGSPVGNDTGAADAAPLFATTDGGASWSTRSVPCGVDALTVSLSRAPDGTLLAVCGLDPSTGFQLKSVHRSFDGGWTWTPSFVCNDVGLSPPPACLSAPINGGYLGSIVAVSADRAFLVGARSALLETSDGGATWQGAQDGVGGSALGTADLTFFGSVGFVLGDDESDDTVVAPVLWKTVDGGRTWSNTVPVAG